MNFSYKFIFVPSLIIYICFFGLAITIIYVLWININHIILEVTFLFGLTNFTFILCGGNVLSFL
ncbi:hypothetical protein U3516DRAFT_777856 [Neocallimastix sp. 'constans']